MIRKYLKRFYRLAAPDILIILLNDKKEINRKKTFEKIKAFNTRGINDAPRKEKVIISLTSFPARIDDVCYTVYSLLTQSFKPDMVILWLAEEQFPGHKIPAELEKLTNNGLTVKYTKDTRSFKKLIPSLKEYPDSVIVTADDDIFYPETWLEKLYKSYQKNPGMTHCHRAHVVTLKKDNTLFPYESWEQKTSSGEPSFLNFPTGAGGVLYPPGLLHENVLEEKLFMELCPLADDIWFWAMAIKNNKKIKVVESNIENLLYVDIKTELGLNKKYTLSQENVRENKNDIQLKQVIDYFNLWKKLKP